MTSLLVLLCTPAFALPPPSALSGAAELRELLRRPGHLPPPDAGSLEGRLPLGWDVQHYSFDIQIDLDGDELRGSARIELLRLEGGDIELDANGPEVSALRLGGLDQPIELVDDVLTIADPGTESAVVEVSWSISGPDIDDAGLDWQRDRAFAFNEPYGARTWLVALDDPRDKATVDWTFTVPEGLELVSTGQLLGTTAGEEPGTAVWTWAIEEPLPTYVMVFHLGPYVHLVDESGDIPVHTWTWADRQAEAEATFARTGEMLDYFSGLYGDYAWTSYGNALARFGGAMENPTQVSFGEELVYSDWGEIVHAHEMAHHWWGDDVTLSYWPEIWLNEGFASYSEALWYEYNYGREGLIEYMSYMADSYYESLEWEPASPVGDPIFLFGGTVYDKGGCVLHMLRQVMGDEAFFAGLQAYRDRHHHDNATIADFVSAMEEQAGEDLGWFFEPWLYATGEPSWQVGTALTDLGGGRWQVDVQVVQDRPEFRMPAELRLSYADDSVERQTLWVEGEGARITLCLDREPQSVELDPEQIVLLAERGAMEVEVAEGACAPADTGELDSADSVDSGSEDQDSGPMAEAPAEGAYLGKGCGCQSTGGGAGGLFGLLALARRRRRGPAR
jgi:MYXO-CTERM domain-containing protein